MDEVLCRWKFPDFEEFAFRALAAANDDIEMATSTSTWDTVTTSVSTAPAERFSKTVSTEEDATSSADWEDAASLVDWVTTTTTTDDDLMSDATTWEDAVSVVDVGVSIANDATAVKTPSVATSQHLFLAFDTETTGFSTTYDRIRSIAFVPTHTTTADEWSNFYAIVDAEGRKSSPEALAVHKIPEHVRGVSWPCVMAQLMEKTAPYAKVYMVSWTVNSFDERHIRAACERHGIAIPANWCFLSKALKQCCDALGVGSGKGMRKLETIYHKHVDHNHVQVHDALDDTLMLSRILAVCKYFSLPCVRREM